MGRDVAKFPRVFQPNFRSFIQGRVNKLEKCYKYSNIFRQKWVAGILDEVSR